MYRDREYLGDKFIAGSVYYNEFHHPNDLNNLTSVKLCTLNGYATYLSLMTANTAAYPQPAQFELFRRLIPALKPPASFTPDLNSYETPYNTRAR